MHPVGAPRVHPVRDPLAPQQLGHPPRLADLLGPTLLSWLAREKPETYRAFLEADARSVARTGHGNPLASPYHHVILPLASRRDKATEVRWGIADFRRRFGREPEGMWLPEAAVDTETLEVLAEDGIRFTVLGPDQVETVPEGGLPGRVDLPGGRSMAVFVYDGPLSHDVAFGSLAEDARAWVRRMADPETPARWSASPPTARPSGTTSASPTWPWAPS